MSARRGVQAGVTLITAVLVLTGCELTEVTTTAAEDVIVVEALLQRRDDLGGNPSTLTVFLHRTLSGDQGLNLPVQGADVRVIRADGTELPLESAPIQRCVVNTPVQGTGSCYEAMPSQVRGINPGETITLRVRAATGEVMEAVSVVPGAFDLRTTPDRSTCLLAPDRPIELLWTQSQGAWAYLNETSIRDLPAALTDVDPLDLLGLSISASDTTIVFPGEFGIFDRGDLDQDLALALQKGLPAGSRAQVSIAAVDRNYVNWVRGGNFNPSGVVRVPSVRGDGTGFFGTGVVLTFDVVTTGDFPACTAFGG